MESTLPPFVTFESNPRYQGDKRHGVESCAFKFYNYSINNLNVHFHHYYYVTCPQTLHFEDPLDYRHLSWVEFVIILCTNLIASCPERVSAVMTFSEALSKDYFKPWRTTRWSSTMSMRTILTVCTRLCGYQCSPVVTSCQSGQCLTLSFPIDLTNKR